MQCVILAAGEGKRMQPLTLTIPKPLVPVKGKPILEHIIRALPPEVDEIILVIGYLGDQIKNYFGNEFLGRHIHYIVQDQKLGTGHALKLCEPYLRDEPFFFLYGDDLHRPEDLLRVFHTKQVPTILITTHEKPEKFGVVVLDEGGRIIDFEEKPEEPKSNLVSTGAMILDKRLFDYEPDLHSSGEYFLTTMVKKFLKDYSVYGHETKGWHPIASPNDLPSAERFIDENF